MSVLRAVAAERRLVFDFTREVVEREIWTNGHAFIEVPENSNRRRIAHGDAERPGFLRRSRTDTQQTADKQQEYDQVSSHDASCETTIKGGTRIGACGKTIRTSARHARRRTLL